MFNAERNLKDAVDKNVAAKRQTNPLKADATASEPQNDHTIYFMVIKIYRSKHFVSTGLHIYLLLLHAKHNSFLSAQVKRTLF